MEAILHDGMLARECEIIVTDAWPGILEHSGWPMSRDIVNVVASACVCHGNGEIL